MSITVNEKNSNGQLIDKETASFLTTEAFEFARKKVGEEVLVGETTNPNAAVNSFVFEFRNALNAGFFANQNVIPSAASGLYD